jgi:hypothetical protein
MDSKWLEGQWFTVFDDLENVINTSAFRVHAVFPMQMTYNATVCATARAMPLQRNTRSCSSLTIKKRRRGNLNDEKYSSNTSILCRPTPMMYLENKLTNCRRIREMVSGLLVFVVLQIP